MFCPRFKVTDCDLEEVLWVFKVAICDLEGMTPDLEVTICDLKFSSSSGLSWNMKSTGNLSMFLLTA